METWDFRSVEMSKMFASACWLGWIDARLSQVGNLRDMHLAFPHKQTLSCIKDAVGTLNYQLNRELRALANLTRLHVRVGRPTFEQNKPIGHTVAQATGATVFQRPMAFGLSDPIGYSHSEIIRKMLDDKELLSWSEYRRVNTLIPRGRLGENPTVPTELLGPL